MKDYDAIQLVREVTKTLTIFIGAGTYLKGAEARYHNALRSLLNEMLGRVPTEIELHNSDATWDEDFDAQRKKGIFGDELN